jgi:hypothetical protein
VSLGGQQAALIKALAELRGGGVGCEKTSDLRREMQTFANSSSPRWPRGRGYNRTFNLIYDEINSRLERIVRGSTPGRVISVVKSILAGHYIVLVSNLDGHKLTRLE